eukprot:Hpha_TRINITY_DN18956_c0_g1::TRINITY_DN18956_c0_g1_i1::g.17589::m.17589
MKGSLRRTVSAPAGAGPPPMVESPVDTMEPIDVMDTVFGELDALRDWLVRRYQESTLPVTGDDVAGAISLWAAARTCRKDPDAEVEVEQCAALTGEEPSVLLSCTHEAIRVGVQQSMALLSTEAGFDEGGELLEQTSRLVDWHMRLEDQVLFPALRAACQESGSKVPPALHHDSAEVHEAHLRRTLVAQFRSGNVSQVEALAKLRTLAERSFIHMQAEEKAITAVLSTADRRVLANLAPRIIDFDTRELLSHAVPFTVRQLSRSVPFSEGIQPYSRALSKTLEAGPAERRTRFAKTILLHAWEVRPQYAMALLQDGVLEKPAPVRAPLPAVEIEGMRPMFAERSKFAVMKWLEEVDPGMRKAWGWRDIKSQRSAAELTALLAAEQMHEHLADDFAASMQLKDVLVSEDVPTKEIKLYFFIDAVWDVNRRSLFAKAYTRRHKPRGKKMKVFVIDAKLRRLMLKEDRSGDGDGAIPQELDDEPEEL